MKINTITTKCANHLWASLLGVILLLASNIGFTSEKLFSEVTLGTIPKRESGLNNIVRERYVKINFSLLTKIKGAVKSQPPREIVFNMFPGEELIVYPVKIELGSMANSIIWHGRIKNMNTNSVTIAITDNVASGSIRTDNGILYRIKFVNDGVHVIQLIDSSKFPTERQPIIPPQ